MNLDFNIQRQLRSLWFNEIFCFCLLLTICQTFKAPCPTGWAENTRYGTCVGIYQDELSWDDAREHCKAGGGDLFKIEDNITNAIVLDLRQSLGSYWIGLKRENNGGEFKWLDEDIGANYANWADGQPNQSGRVCVAMSLQTRRGYWYDRLCTSMHQFVCEMHQVPVCDDQTYGANCSRRCSPYCAGPGRACDNMNGSCLSGCDVGYKGDKCDTVCDDQTYGANCSRRCSPYCAGPGRACDNMNGSCLSGCDVGYQGDKCDILDTMKKENVAGNLRDGIVYSTVAVISASCFAATVAGILLACGLLVEPKKNLAGKERSADQSAIDRSVTGTSAVSVTVDSSSVGIALYLEDEDNMSFYGPKTPVNFHLDPIDEEPMSSGEIEDPGSQKSEDYKFYDDS